MIRLSHEIGNGDTPKMGFAKYQEDNYSRYHGTSIVRRNEHDRFAPASDTNKSTNQGTQKKMNTSKLKDFTVA